MKGIFQYSVITLSLFQSWALVADTQPNKENDIEKITITASRTAKLNTDLALSIGQVTEEVIKNDNAQHLSDSLQTIPGVLINQLSGGQGHNAAIRMPINYGGYTLYLQDNIPLQSAAFYNHNGLWWASSNSSLSRLEVLKGAGTSLYGSGAVAATVNVISAPVFDNKNELSVSLGDHGYQRFNGSKTVFLNENNGFRVSAGYLNNDGWRDHSAVKKSELNVMHEVEIDSQQRVKTSVVASKLDQQMLNTLEVEQFLVDPTQSGLSDEVLAIDPRRNTDYLRISSEYTYETDNVLFSAIPYVRHRTNDYIATWQKNMPKVESSVDTLGLLALTNFVHDNDFETTFGVDLERSEGESFSFQPTTITTTGWGGATYPKDHVFYNYDAVFTGISPYFQHIGSLSDSLSYSIGARYDFNEYEFKNNLPVYDNDGFGNRSIASRSDSFKHISPKASLNYKITQQQSVYLRFANAIRIPTASELYNLKSKESSAQIGSVKEESSDTYEIGYKANFNRMAIEVAYYFMDVTDAIVTAYDNFDASYRVNASSVDHKGVELGINYHFNDSLDFALAYSQSDHEFDHYIKDKGRVGKEGKSKEVDLSGNSLQMAPEYVVNFRLNYISKLFDGLIVTAELKSIGDYYLNVENTQKYSGYSVMNIKANYQLNQNLKLHARVENITDKAYALQNEIRYGTTRIQPGVPRAFYVGLNYAF